MDFEIESGILEEKLNKAFRDLEIISLQKFLSKTRLLKSIKNKDYITYTHLMRVGLLGKNIGELINSYNIINFKITDFFIACLLHDMGKLYSNPRSLSKVKGFDEDDMEDMKKHPLDGYELLKELFIFYDQKILDFSAEISLRHHRHKKEDYYPEDYYPVDITEFEQNISKKSKGVFELYSKILSIIDFYDSFKNRKNDKYGKKTYTGKIKFPKPRQAKKILLKNYLEDKDFINELYEKGIFE